MKQQILTYVAAAGLIALAGNASALSLFNESLLQDQNREYLNVDLNQNGNLDQGDTLRGIFTIDSISNLAGPGTVDIGPGAPTELTAIFEAEVATKTFNAITNRWDYTFTAIAGGVNGLGNGATFGLYTGATNLDIDGCGNIAACEGFATDGAHWMTIGFGDADDQWVANDVFTDMISIVSGFSGTSDLGDFTLTQSILTNNTGYTFLQQNLLDPGVALFECVSGVLNCAAGDGLVDIVANGQIFGGFGLTTGYDARSDFRFQMSRVPEPGTILLFGLGLMGLAGASRRRKV